MMRLFTNIWRVLMFAWVYAFLATNVLGGTSDSSSSNQLSDTNILSTGTSKLNTDSQRAKLSRAQLKEFQKRSKAALEILHSVPLDREHFEREAVALARDFPQMPNGYADLLMLITSTEEDNLRHARELAEWVVRSQGPQQYVEWCQGFLKRTSTSPLPFELEFVSLDGKVVSLAQLKGKVVLIDFWSTRCAPCLVSIQKLKGPYEKYKAQGFEILGISYDSDISRANKWVKRNGISWPQYADGTQFEGNRIAREFGVLEMPHMILLDKEGSIRLDHVSVDEKFDSLIHDLLQKE